MIKRSALNRSVHLPYRGIGTLLVFPVADGGKNIETTLCICQRLYVPRNAAEWEALQQRFPSFRSTMTAVGEPPATELEDPIHV